jgi:hypothetical protein
VDKQELENILQELKAELAASEFAKPSSRQELQRLIDQIEAFLVADEMATQNALNEPLNDAVTRFEVSHPKLTAILNNIITTLSNMGI